MNLISQSLTLPSGASLNNSGTIHIVSGRKLRIGEDYTQEENGTLSIDILSTSASRIGQLDITGTADLSGTIDAKLGDDFLPDLDDVFPFMTAGTLVGTFETVTGDLPPSADFLWTFQADTGSLIASATSASFEVTFDSTWSAETHPLDFPSGPHFSGLIDGTHNANMAFWEDGGIASEGIERMAELGSKSPLQDEIDAAINAGDAFSLISGGGISPSPGVRTLDFEMNVTHPLVTLVSMIAPSPDWFVGVSGLQLFENETWLDEVEIDLFAYDAGTDSGEMYVAPDVDITPHVPITLMGRLRLHEWPTTGNIHISAVVKLSQVGK